MLPTIIPDSMLAGSNVDKWTQMVANSFKKVRGTCEIYCPPDKFTMGVSKDFTVVKNMWASNFYTLMLNEVKI